jgi:hypothetical protein
MTIERVRVIVEGEAYLARVSRHRQISRLDPVREEPTLNRESLALRYAPGQHG